ncbi:MAG: hypothetical protein EKK48_00425 [Candidatus Melainabacteria bacterium]|nr:MAG: hypothetical protein EKK48_00425 [Candidatus Melainabacteria bacterium]
MHQQQDKANIPTYQLGQVKFAVTNCDELLEQELRSCLPICRVATAENTTFYDAKSDSIKNIVDLINHIHKRHEGTLWILGAGIVSPSGRKLLIAGPSHTGKSTTAMALVFGFGWKVLSEDITHIDITENEIINFASPFAVKRGTLSSIQNALKAFDKTLDLSSFDTSSVKPTCWAPLENASTGCNLSTPFDHAVVFEQFDDHDLRCDHLTSLDYMRALLPISNIARLSQVSNKFYNYVAEDSCYRLAGGNLKQRLDRIIQLCDEPAVRDKQNELS